MLWRKAVDHNPQFVIFSDKLATKEFMGRCCPDLPVPKVLWIGRDADAIPDEVLRQDVFVKANHGCDFNHRIRDGRCDRAILRDKARRWLGSVYGRGGGEWSYSQVEPKLFVEDAIGDAERDLLEFQVRASNGRVILGSVIGNSKTPAQWYVYLDAEGRPTQGVFEPSASPAAAAFEARTVAEPYRRAVAFTRRLSVGVDYARFDFLWNGKDLFGGEITVYPAGGVSDPATSEANTVVLNGWDMLPAHFLNAPQSGWRRWYAEALKRRWAKPVAVSTPVPMSGSGLEITIANQKQQRQ
jgi:hypothetical protein